MKKHKMRRLKKVLGSNRVKMRRGRLMALYQPLSIRQRLDSITKSMITSTEISMLKECGLILAKLQLMWSDMTH